ncbi:MAG: hypothetical protein WC500_00025 [Candidatus Margulisiibacteriota bacterium]
MKKIYLSLLIAVCLATLVSAEMLITANPIGQGKWGFAGAYMQDSNLQAGGLTSLSLTTYGGYAAYGLTDKLDLLLSLGSATVGNIPATFGGIPMAGSAMSMTAYGLTAKYTLIDEGTLLPVSVAFGAGYKSVTSSTTNPTIAGGGTTTANGSQILAGFGCSKIIIPFVPYAGLMYRSNASGGSTVSTQLDLTLGTAIAWSRQGAVLLEYTSQSITPNGGSAYTSGQMAASVTYTL